MRFLGYMHREGIKPRAGKNSFLPALLIAALFACVPAYSQSYRETVTAATALLENKDYDGAIAGYEKALAMDSLNSMNDMIYANLALAYMKKGNAGRVEDVYRKALARNPQSKMLLLRRADFYLTQGKEDKALRDYNEVLAKDSADTEALFFRAYILTGKKKYNLARKDYYTILAADPDNEKAQFALALLYAREREDNKAMLLLDNLIERNPANPEYYLACSNIEKSGKRYELALIYIDEGIKSCKERNALNMEKAELLVAMDRCDEARRVLNALTIAGYSSPRMKTLYKKCR